MARKKKSVSVTKDKSLETWIWDAACSIRGAKDAPKFRDFILPLFFTSNRMTGATANITAPCEFVPYTKQTLQIGRQ